MTAAENFNWNRGAALFLQCVLQSRNKSLDPAGIIATGDYLDHSVFTWEEFSTSLENLLAAGYLEIKGEQITLTNTFENDYKALGKAPKSVSKEYQQLQKLLQKKELPAASPQHPFTQHIFDAAVKAYLER